jgi:hypothetical protein
MRPGFPKWSARVVAIAAACLLVGLAAVARGESFHSLQAAEQAFYEAGLPFEFDWKPNRLLRPSPKTGGAGPGPTRDGNPATPVPPQLLGQLRGWAGGVDARTFKVWTVAVFDRASAAIAYAQLATRTAQTLVALRANNVVYVGTPFPAAARAIGQLRHE